jgi:hypothetical protein
MGLFDLFRRKDSPESSDRELLRLKKMVASKLSQNLDRQDALERLAQMGTAEAAEILLTRFGWTLDPSITDQDEKALALSGVILTGEAALGPIRRHCLRSESLVWPIKALRGILTGDALRDELLTLLDEFDTEYVRNAEPKVQLLQALEEFPGEETRVAVEPFLADMSEAVRFAAVTTVFAVAGPAALPSLVAALTEDESLRVRNRIGAGLVERAWPMTPELKALAGSKLPPGFRVAGDVLVGTPQT